MQSRPCAFARAFVRLALGFLFFTTGIQVLFNLPGLLVDTIPTIPVARILIALPLMFAGTVCTVVIRGRSA